MLVTEPSSRRQPSQRKSILLLGSELVDLAIDARAILAKRFPDHNVTALTDSTSADSLRAAGFDHVIVMADSQQGRSWNLLTKLMRIRSLGAAKIVLIGERGLLGTPLLALGSGIKEKYLFTSKAKLIRLNLRSRSLLLLLRMSFLELGLILLTPALWALIAGVLTVEALVNRMSPVSNLSGRVITPDEIGGAEVTIVIPNWNGLRLGVLEPCLASLVKVPGVCEGRYLVLVSDDGSDDESVSFIQERYPSIRVLKSDCNRGFIAAANAGGAAALTPLIFFLNNDVTVEPDFLDPLIELINARNDAAAVAPRLTDSETLQPQWGVTMAGVLADHIYCWNELENAIPVMVDTPQATLYAIGGALLVRRQWWRRLGGFDSLYEPHTWEDIDLSYRIWKSGGTVLYAPVSGIFHKSHVSIRTREGLQRLTSLHVRNQYLFLWKNITDRCLLLRHVKAFPGHLITRMFRGEPAYIAGVLGAVWRLPQAIRARRLARYERVLNDSMILRGPLLAYEQAVKRLSKLEVTPRILMVVADLKLVGIRGSTVRKVYERLASEFNVHVMGFIPQGVKLEEFPRELSPELTVVALPSPADQYNPLYLFPTRVLNLFSTEFDDRVKKTVKAVAPDILLIVGLGMAQYAYHADKRPVIVLVDKMDAAATPLTGWQRKRTALFLLRLKKQITHLIVVSESAATTLRTLTTHHEVCQSSQAAVAEDITDAVLTSLVRVRNRKVRKGYLQ